MVVALHGRVFPQVAQGSMAAGFLFNGNHHKTSHDTLYDATNISRNDITHSWRGSFSPEVNYFVRTNLAIGLNFSYVLNSMSNRASFSDKYIFPTDYITKKQSFGVGLHCTKYWFVQKKLAIVFTPSFTSYHNVNSVTSKVENPGFPNGSSSLTKTTNDWDHVASLNLGVQYFATARLALCAQTVLTSIEVGQNYNDLNIMNAIWPPRIGAQYYFSRDRVSE